jgi:lipopolysaccharide transport system ATP-binding protein
MVDTAIDVSGIGKRLRIGAKQESYKTLRELIVQLASAPFRLGSAARGRAAQDNQFWALQDISFKVARGEVVGVIGRNGAGKSTLLKILSRITEPTTGKALLRGRVASMLEVGTGFHPELTGRENIYLNGAVIGMKREEIKRKFDEIVAFSEVEKFVDTPVKHYSSGMYLRLAFAVSAHLEHEILLIDEVLAVGDAEFQKKCIGKIGDVAKAGRTILFVSHNMGAVENLCKTSLVLDAGRLAYYGDTKDAIAQYLSRSASLEEQQKLTGAQRRPGQGRVRFERVWAEQDGHCTTTLTSGGDVDIIIEYKVHKPEPSRASRWASFGATTWADCF